MRSSWHSGSFFPLEAALQGLQTFSQLLPMLFLAVFAVAVTLVAARLFRWEPA